MSNHELRGRMRRMLKDLSHLAEHSSLTGAYRDGAGEAAKKYNAVLEWLRKEDSTPEWFFSPLPADADWSRVGIESRMLASYLGDEDKHRHRHGEPGDPGMLVALAPFMEQEDLVKLVEARMSEANFDEGILVALAPFVGSEMLGRLVRRKLDQQAPPAPPPAPTPPVAPVPPSPVQDLTPATRPSSMPVSGDYRDVIDALEKAGLTPEQHAEIAEHLMRLRG